jgi:hypothetical protein
MQQEFITSRGKAIIENNILFIRNFKFNFFDTVVGRMIFPLALAVAIVLQFGYIRGPLDYYIGVFWVIFFVFNCAGSLYDTIIRRSFAHRIPLNKIKFIETKTDQFGLEKELRLHLKNGRYRPLIFRIHEKQFEPFIEFISKYIIQPQFA